MSLLPDIIRDARDVRISHAYDDGGRLLSQSASQFAVPSDPLGGAPGGGLGGGTRPDPILTATQRRSFAYDELGRLTSATAEPFKRVLPPGGNDRPAIISHFAWDSFGLRTKEWNSVLGESLAVAHGYDALGRLKASQIGPEQVTWKFDGVGRLVDVTTSGKLEAHFDYAAGLGGPTKRRYGNGVETSFTYDALARLQKIEDQSTNSGTRLSRWRWEMPADGVPRVAAQSRLGQPEVASLFTVDQAGRLLSETHGATGMDSVSIRPDMGRLLGNQLVSPIAERMAAETRSYKLDARHNWVELDSPSVGLDMTPAINNVDAYTKFGIDQVTYDRRGAVTGIGAGESYSYDLFGQVTLVKRGGVERRYEYDALGRVVSERVGEGGAIPFGWDGARLAVTLRPPVRFGADIPGFTDVMVGGAGLDEHLFRLTREQGSSGAPLPVEPGRVYYHQDRAGSVYMVSDRAGAAAEFYTYSAYGEMSIQGPNGTAFRERSEILNRWGFQGHVVDPHTGLTNMRARWYRPEWGRFVSPDPIGLAGGSNLYAFVSSAPLRFRDPLGLLQESVGRPRAEEVTFWRNQILGGRDPFSSGIPLDVAQSIATEYGGVTSGDIIRTYIDLVAEGAGESLVSSAAGTISAVRHPIATAQGVAELLANPETRDLAIQQVIAGLDRLAQGDPRTVGAAVAEAGTMFLGVGSKVGTAARVAENLGDAGEAGRVGRMAGTYGELRRAGAKDAHHVIQDAAVRNLPGYDRKAAPAIELPGPSTRVGSPHYTATRVQEQAGGGTYAAERRIGYKALRRAGLSPAQARHHIEIADEYFRSLGVTPSTGTRVPGNR